MRFAVNVLLHTVEHPLGLAPICGFEVCDFLYTAEYSLGSGGFGSRVEIFHSPDIQTEVTQDSEVLEGAKKDKGEEKVYKHDLGVPRKRRPVA